MAHSTRSSFSLVVLLLLFSVCILPPMATSLSLSPSLSILLIWARHSFAYAAPHPYLSHLWLAVNLGMYGHLSRIRHLQSSYSSSTYKAPIFGGLFHFGLLFCLLEIIIVLSLSLPPSPFFFLRPVSLDLNRFYLYGLASLGIAKALEEQTYIL